MTASPIDHDAEMMADGRQRLESWLPAARAACASGMDITMMSALAKAQAPYLVEDNLEALVIYPAPLGGWHADLLLKTVPAGVANSLGTPINAPARTQAEADARGRDILCLALYCASKSAPTSLPPAFLLYDCVIPLEPAILAQMRELAPGSDHGYGHADIALARIEAALTTFCPEGFNYESFNERWSHGAQIALLCVLHIAALTGVLAYPARYHAPPRHDRSAEVKQ